VILVDANLILYAEDSLSSHHQAARDWWDGCLSGSDPVCLCWPVLTAFLRITTNARIMRRPLTRDEACGRVARWLDQPCVRVIHVTRNHWEILRELIREADATANLVPDAHLAAMAIAHGCTLCSSDRDFGRFRSLRWFNPLSAG
jgi:hypothetical protein